MCIKGNGVFIMSFGIQRVDMILPKTGTRVIKINNSGRIIAKMVILGEKNNMSSVTRSISAAYGNHNINFLVCIKNNLEHITSFVFLNRLKNFNKNLLKSIKIVAV